MEKMSGKPEMAGKILLIGLVLMMLLFAAERTLWLGLKWYYPMKYKDEMLCACEKYNVPPSVAFATAKTESNFRADAISSKGATGLMQITPDTYDWILSLQNGKTGTIALADITPSENIDAGVFFLRWLYDNLGDWETVWAAYNAGYGKVNQWLMDSKITTDGKLTAIPYEETANYVKKAVRARAQYQKLYGLE